MNNYKKVVVITGAGSGIGRSLAINYADRGYKLALCDINKKTLDQTIKLIPKNINVYMSVFNASNQKQFNKFAKDVIKEYKKVDIVINNAGVGINKFRADEVSFEDYEWILKNNLWSVINGSLAFLPYLRKQNQSNLVNVSSAFGLHGTPGQAPYSTAKFAIRGFTEALELEEKIHQTGVSVSCVYPGGVQTNIAKSSLGADQNPETIIKFEKTYYLTADQAAKIIIKGIDKNKSKILVGTYAQIFHFISNRYRFIIKKYLAVGYKRL